MPTTVDGVTVTFVFLPFRAVRRGKAPDRCYRVVSGAAAASASVNCSHEYGQSWSVLASGYVRLLCVLGIVMFFLSSSRWDGQQDPAREPEVRAALVNLAQQHPAGGHRVLQAASG